MIEPKLNELSKQNDRSFVDTLDSTKVSLSPLNYTPI